MISFFLKESEEVGLFKQDCRFHETLVFASRNKELCHPPPPLRISLPFFFFISRVLKVTFAPPPPSATEHPSRVTMECSPLTCL